MNHPEVILPILQMTVVGIVLIRAALNLAMRSHGLVKRIFGTSALVDSAADSDEIERGARQGLKRRLQDLGKCENRC